MGVLMIDLSIYNIRDLQNLQPLLTDAINDGGDLKTISDTLATELSSRLQSLTVTTPAPAARRRSDNITTCPACGSPAVIVPLSRADRSPAATHAIQCQNRPRTDQPWLAGMCGHTEYLVRGER
jgi:hypothetical protein